MKFEPRISIVTLGVSDMAKSRAFYEALGWKASSASNENVTFFQGRGLVFGLYGHDALAEDAGCESGPQSSYRGTSLSYNCRSPEEVDEAFAFALQCGAKKQKAPEKVFWGGYSGYVADPDGHLWEIAHNPFAEMNAEGQLIIESGS